MEYYMNMHTGEIRNLVQGINLYAGFSNEITGEAFRCISYNKEACVFEWVVQPGGYVPFEHIHMSQDEVFHIKKGEVTIFIDEKEYIGRAGDTITVPKGKRHICRNNSAGIMTCIVEYRPGLDQYKFFQCFAGLTMDRYMDKKGQINITKMLYFSQKMKAQCMTRPANIPAPFLKLTANLFYIIGFFSGWNKLYKKYTGERTT
jgi:uncharacterized cupin superfamily protein